MKFGPICNSVVNGAVCHVEPADIQPQAALPIDSGKGAVTDAVLTDIERTVCRIHAP